MSQDLLNPRGIFHLEENPIASRLPNLNQKVMGLVDNSKPNAGLFLDNVHELLCEKYAIPKIIRIQKPSVAAPTTFTQEFFDACDYVINALGD